MVSLEINVRIETLMPNALRKSMKRVLYKILTLILILIAQMTRS